jgi:hypothetical protein
MHLIQIFLPLMDDLANPNNTEVFFSLQTELKDKFGGITTFSQAPAKGLWKDSNQKTVRDEIIIFEVMTASVDAAWWASFKARLEKMFDQKEIIIRKFTIDLL